MDARPDLGNAEHTGLADREIVATRMLDAPRERVFAAWTDTAHLEQWWGPVGFTNTTHRADIRTGGEWRFTMHAPDGRDYGNRITFLEVTPPSRIACRHGGEAGTEDVDFSVVAEFAEEGGRTRLTMRMRFATNEARDDVIAKYGAFEGLEETLGRLRDHVALEDAFAITRAFDAPLPLVWRAHTEVAHLEKWWGPRGFTVFHAKLDLRPGGSFHYGMRTAQGQEMWGRFAYREILPMRRLVWVNSFSDPEGRVVRHPASPDWPLEMLVMASFREEAGRTILAVRSAPIGASASERRVFRDGYKSMEGGFGGTYAVLAGYLATLRQEEATWLTRTVS